MSRRGRPAELRMVAPERLGEALHELGEHAARPTTPEFMLGGRRWRFKRVRFSTRCSSCGADRMFEPRSRGQPKAYCPETGRHDVRYCLSCGWYLRRAELLELLTREPGPVCDRAQEALLDVRRRLAALREERWPD